MHINWFEFNDSTYGISIDRTYFDKINLLVGVSGGRKNYNFKGIVKLY